MTGYDDGSGSGELSVIEVSGLDQRVAAFSAPRGSLRDMVNFEFDQEQGAVRSRGWGRYDGTVMGPDLDTGVVITYFGGAITGTFQYGELITIQQSGLPQQTLICLGQSSVGFGLYLAAAYPYTNYTNWVDPTTFGTSATVVGLTSGATLTSLAAQPQIMNDAGFTVAQYNAIKRAIQVQHAASIGPVPGDPLRPVDCEFGFSNNAYAIHDCWIWPFDTGVSGAGGPPIEGHYLRGSTGVLAGVTIGRILFINIASGSFDTAGSAATGYFAFYDAPLGMAMPNPGDRFDLYSANNTALIRTNIFRFTNAFSIGPRFTRALLYQTTDQVAAVKTLAGNPPPAEYMDRIATQRGVPRTWIRPRHTREIPYTQKYGAGVTGAGFAPVGANDFSIYEYSRQGLTQQLQANAPITAPEKFPTVATAAAVNPPTATGWVNPNNIFADDGVFATDPGNALLIRGSGFDFSFIPPGSRILGITARVKGLASVIPVVLPFIQSVYLTIPDPSATPNFGSGWRQGVQNKAANNALTAASTSYTFGGPTDQWGEQLTVAALQDPNFGVMVSIGRIGAGATVYSLDCLTLTVTYVPPTRQVFLRNTGSTTIPVTDIPVFILHYCIDNGSFTDAGNPAQGVLTFWVQTTAAGAIATEGDATNAGMARIVGAGEEIWTGPGATGTKLGYTNGGHSPISFPAGSMLDQFQSRYKVIDANFYDDVNARAAFVANGVEFATMFDGTYTVRIRTGRPTDQDNPRQIANHLGYLHLGFASGAVVNCGTNRPLSVIGAPGSNTYNFGEPIVGMLTLNGQTLGVWTDRCTRGLQGSSPAPSLGGYTPIIISPSIGAIEYSLANVMGEAVWMSFRGVETVQTVISYGDFQTFPLSQKATPFLRDRIQIDRKIATIPSRLVYAVGVRNHRQYKAFFEDGFVFTLTMYDAPKEPECSIQCIGRPVAPATFPDVGVQSYLRAVVRHVYQCVRTDGKEQIFASFENLSPVVIGSPLYNFPFVVQLDVGNTWDIGLDMPCWIDFNALYFGLPEQDQKFQSVTVLLNALSGTQIRAYTMTNFDGPMDILAAPFPGDPNVNIRQITTQRWPAATDRAYLPIPQVAQIIDIPATGRMLRLRLDANQDVDSNVTTVPVRITHLSFQLEPELVKRS